VSGAPSTGSDQSSRRDGYLRVHGGRRLVSRQSELAENDSALLFVDVEQAMDAGVVISALQEAPPRLAHTKYILLRVPDVLAGATPGEEEDAARRAREWAEALLARRLAISSAGVHLGVVQFRVGRTPQIHWADGTGDRHVSDFELLQRALRVELLTLLEFGHAIWRPDSYHYQLPSGQHAASFIRVGDAFRSPRDVHALATWLTPRLRDEQAIVADSASLVPLITEIQALIRRHGWTPGPVEMLDEYPRTRLDINRVIRPLLSSSGGALGLMSVNSSGRYQGMFMSTLEQTFGDADWSMVVIVSKTDEVGDRVFICTDDDVLGHPVSTWLGFSDKFGVSMADSACTWCKDPKKSQLVRIDPRTFEALALPDVALLMPSFHAATQSTAFWDLCNTADAIGALARPADSPSTVSRPKLGLMNVLVEHELLLGCDDLVSVVSARLDDLEKEGKRPDYSQCTAVVVSKWDASLPRFEERFDALRPVLGLDHAEIIEADANEEMLPVGIKDHKHLLVFSLGVVSGWNLRQLLTRVQEAWRPEADRHMYGLVLHARPQTAREWENLYQSFERRLTSLWRTYVPWRDPLKEESTALKELPLDGLSDQAVAFHTLRSDLLSARPVVWRQRVSNYDRAGDNDDRGLDPRAVFWGLAPHGGSDALRRQSLYGFEARPLTAYAAIGAAMHGTRQDSQGQLDPRRRMFDMPSITRSYYDAIIIAGVLRWAEPQETWWGSSDQEAQNAVSELLARTVEEKELKILIPELLYAASQGKMPRLAAEHLKAEAELFLKYKCIDNHRGPTELGLALLKNAWDVAARS
jgi:hypothetical protein